MVGSVKPNVWLFMQAGIRRADVVESPHSYRSAQAGPVTTVRSDEFTIRGDAVGVTVVAPASSTWRHP